MSYKFYYASVKGTSHKKTNTPKQDNLCVLSLDVNNVNYLISAIADGAGTAKYSDKSSNYICRFLTRKMSNWLKDNEILHFEKKIFSLWINEFQVVLKRYIRIKKLDTIRNFATTILFCVLSEKGNIFAQIGDGAISIEVENDLNCAFKPQKGEYANTTCFATDINFENNLMFKMSNDDIQRLAMHTDGIEMISLVKLEIPSPAFFNPLFECLKDEPAGYNEGLSEELTEFLDSDRVNKKTNDDKTLVIAVKMENNG